MPRSPRSPRSLSVALVCLTLAVGAGPGCKRRVAPRDDRSLEPAPQLPPAPPQPLTRSTVQPAEVMNPPRTAGEVKPTPAGERVRRGDVDFGPIEPVGATGGISVESVARLLRGQQGGLRGCYERELRDAPTLAGTITLTFTIGPSGRVTSASTAGLDAAPAVGTCMLSRIRGLVFPSPEVGVAAFRQPLELSPGS
ncbi:MAG: AgmX/PglI C-terminal domain-containing protein [Deltaproteobacteria bacterium]|nr:AgmX/PglI C-terminal domain-containing protein [Myxococcales bacterium]MDP3213623.1 AgmX/PglI C-terminal domain-containing protein [Deltaproteobacteria bacterium]